MKAVQGKKKNKAANFVIQGSILAMAGILVRIIGMLYRMPLNDIIGKQGNGYYTSAYNVYNILLILSSYSMPVAISKMISARLAKGEYENCRRILKAGLLYATVTGGLAAIILWFGSDFFAGLIKTPYSSYALKTLAPTIWIMAYLGPSAKHPVTRKEIFFHFLWHTRQSISRFYQIFPFFHIISKSTLISILFCVHHVIMACKDNGLTGSVPSFYQSPWYRPAKAVFRQEIFSCLLRILLKVRLLCQLLCNIVCAAFFCLCIGSAGDFYQFSYIPFN